MKAFNRWDVDGIKIEDLGLRGYISLEAKIVPRTGGRDVSTRFHKSTVFIVERLINKVMGPGHRGKKHSKSSGHMTGKKEQAYNIVEKAFEIIEKQVKKNPVEVFVKAVEMAAPREEVITIEYGGARYPRAVEVAPQRRVDIVLRMMTQGAYHSSFNKKVSIEKTLANEIIAAYNGDLKSVALSKKRDVERQAASSK